MARRLPTAARTLRTACSALFARVQRVSARLLEHPGRRGRGGAAPRLLLSSGKRGSPPSVRGWAHPPCTLGLQRSLWEGCELSAQSPTEEGDPRLTGSLEQSLQH
ncbi:unnamed protein product [Rangifer tarandus platyrhynchus]|uniref:Uncharacterized protein n=1 Tax=Rangifer tarandus platyrhynchus TaxID=3082113 RepID=A0AC59YT45_RANTA